MTECPSSSLNVVETDVVVIGAGPAGMFTVFQLGLQGIHAHLVDALPHLGGQCSELYAHKPIYDIPGITACTGSELAQRLATQMAPFAPTLHLGQQVQTLQCQPDGRWLLVTSKRSALCARAVVIAAGVGAFVPRTLKLAGIEALVDTAKPQVHYHPANLTGLPLLGQQVLVYGGDELAVQAAIDALDHQPASVTLIHRRDVFSVPDVLLAQLRTLQDEGRIRILAAQLVALDTVAGSFSNTITLQGVQLCRSDGCSETVPVQQMLVYQGISPKLGPLADWGLALEKKQLAVETATFSVVAAGKVGLYAVGDINTYPGKRKLLICAFHEATIAAFAIAEQISAGPVLLQYTTTSTKLHTLLGQIPV